ncbi:MAG: ribonuclease Z [Bacteroidales bacterium]|nr:ribonuclease Z [Bacteroidales bacterium]
MGFKVTILGSSAAVPTIHRSLSSQVLEHEQTLYLIDCGEGAQLQMLKYAVRLHKIDHIFISHLHGDHYLGLQGFLNTLSMENRKKELTLYAPKPLHEFLEAGLALSGGAGLDFPLHFVALEDGKATTIFENSRLTVETVPLFHRVPTWGFIFREKEKERNIKHDFIETYQPDFLTIKAIKQGADFVDKQGNTIPNTAITTAPKPPASYAYFSDTCFDETLATPISGIDVLYHEATFSDAEAHLAGERYHATSRQAATLAQKANVKRLLLGHISSRFLNDASALEQQAQEVFPNTTVVSDGDEYWV